MGVERYLEKRFVPYSKFFRVFITCFPSSIEQEQCLKTVTNSQPLASNLNNQFSQELGKQVTHTWKTFLTANLDNYSNKILFLWGVGDQRYFARKVKPCVLYSIWLGIAICYRFYCYWRGFVNFECTDLGSNFHYSNLI